MAPLLEVPDNSAVHWDGTRFGLTPTLSNEVQPWLSLGDKAVPPLLEALADANRFVVAHVLLTHLSGMAYTTFPLWNELAVTLMPDGEVIIDPAQRQALYQRWHTFFHSEPHSNALPPLA